MLTHSVHSTAHRVLKCSNDLIQRQDAWTPPFSLKNARADAAQRVQATMLPSPCFTDDIRFLFWTAVLSSINCKCNASNFNQKFYNFSGLSSGSSSNRWRASMFSKVYFLNLYLGYHCCWAFWNRTPTRYLFVILKQCNIFESFGSLDLLQVWISNDV